MNNNPQVDEFMDKLNHPFKAEIQALREIIMAVHPKITEEIKWAAPSFSYREYMVTFNLWEENRVHLVFHNGAILANEDGILEGEYRDRRMVYFTNVKDVKAKKPALEKLIKEWIKIMDAKPIEVVEPEKATT